MGIAEIILTLLCAGLFLLVILYKGMKPEERAKKWFKLSCYAKAYGEAIELRQHRYNEYKVNMGVQS